MLDFAIGEFRLPAAHLSHGSIGCMSLLPIIFVFLHVRRASVGVPPKQAEGFSRSLRLPTHLTGRQ